MSGIKTLLKKLNKTHLQIAGVLLLVLLAVVLLWVGNSKSAQSIDTMPVQVYFEGEYRIEDGPWQKIVRGEHISATQGDVTLRGDFHMFVDGEYLGVYRGDEEGPIAFFVNHINLTFYENGKDPVVIEMENPEFYGHCGESWSYNYFSNESEDLIEILVHNPHSFGNENAIDEMLSKLTYNHITDYLFEDEILASGEVQRNAGILLMLFSLLFIGTALFSSLIHIKNSKIIWLLGFLVSFAGLYFAYSADGVSLWNDSIVSNTTILGLSMMFYMLLLLMSIVYFLKETKLIASIAVIALAVANAVFFILPMATSVLFYDTWPYWIVVQIVANIVVAACLIKEFTTIKSKKSWIYIGALLPLIAFAIDVIGTLLGVWEGGIASQCVFVALFVIAIIIVLRLIPNNINAAAKAKELEVEKTVLNAQLAESRVSTMMSQIRPHFIYNTLGSIEQLCKLDPPKAGELVHNFAKYLRGNFGELDNPKPILMSQEMEHVHHYISIENVRFPDMTFSFEMNSSDFKIPALTVQPIVENAIKHGLMKLSKGGTINVVSYETDTDYCISVVDDGVGFDMGAAIDEKKHVGLRNIRERLKVMVNGTLEIESTVGVGTRVLIKIPKEAEV